MGDHNHGVGCRWEIITRRKVGDHNQEDGCRSEIITSSDR